MLPRASFQARGLLLMIIAALSAGSNVAASAGQRAFFTVDDAVRADPSSTGAVVVRVKAGAVVTLGERRGFWRRVESLAGSAGAASASGGTGAASATDTVGWVRLSSLRLPNAKPAPGLAAMTTGREAAGNIALVSGARSVAGRGAWVEPDGLRAAKADETAVGNLASTRVDPELRARFIAEGGLVRRNLARRAAVAASGRNMPTNQTTAEKSPATAVERELAAKIFGVARPVADAALQRYLAQVGDVLVQASAGGPSAPAPNWRFVLLETPSLLTFALPDGLVLLSRGFFAELASEDELAAVLAREIMHVQSQHHWRRLRSPPLETYLRPLDAELEFRVDALGMRLAAAAGYDASALIAVLERIDAATAAGRDTRLLRAVMPSVSDRMATLAAAATPELERASVPSAAATRIRPFGGGTSAAAAQGGNSR